MKTELKMRQRLTELTNDFNRATKEHSEISAQFAELKRVGDPKAENYNPHPLELIMFEAKGKISILKEILEIKE